MQRHLSNQSGITLVELVIGMALTVLLMTAVVSLLSTSLQAWQTGSRKTEVQQTARFALDSVARELRYASNVVVDENKSGITFKKNDTVSNEDTIYIYCSSNGVLRRVNKSEGGGAQPITGENNVKVAATFELDTTDNRTVSINLTAIDSYTDKLPRQSITLKTTVVSLNVPPR
ncbi:MAG: hypothetical protein GX348_04630 [Veillonellaceae bacterium]|jgi:Tfp pilus assembly protein PilW|nr:hypothetical protein [Veillonellaceae bacterium]